MTRKQFLITLGLAFVALFGFSTIVGILSGDQPKRITGAGYGQQGYGR